MEEEFIECLMSYMKEANERKYEEYLVYMDLKNIVHNFYVNVYRNCEDDIRDELEEEIKQRYADAEYV